MKFWDSSAVVPLLVAEPVSASVQRLYARDPAMLVWWGAETECASAIARLERDGELTPASTEEAFARLDSLTKSWNEIQPLVAVRRTARRLLRMHRLRAGDALQLAAALVAAEGDASSLELVCLDEQLVAAARQEGLPVVTDT